MHTTTHTLQHIYIYIYIYIYNGILYIPKTYIIINVLISAKRHIVMEIIKRFTPIDIGMYICQLVLYLVRQPFFPQKARRWLVPINIIPINLVYYHNSVTRVGRGGSSFEMFTISWLSPKECRRIYGSRHLTLRITEFLMGVGWPISCKLGKRRKKKYGARTELTIKIDFIKTKSIYKETILRIMKCMSACLSASVCLCVCVCVCVVVVVVAIWQSVLCYDMLNEPKYIQS